MVPHTQGESLRALIHNYSQLIMSLVNMICKVTWFEWRGHENSFVGPLLL